LKTIRTPEKGPFEILAVRAGGYEPAGVLSGIQQSQTFSRTPKEKRNSFTISSGPAMIWRREEQ